MDSSEWLSLFVAPDIVCLSTRFIGFPIVTACILSSWLIFGMGAIAQAEPAATPKQKQVTVQQILNFQTPGYAVRVLQRGEQRLVDIYEKSQRNLLLIQAPVTVKAMPEGLVYVHQQNDRTYTIRVQTTGKTSLEITVGHQILIQEDELL